MDCFQDFCLNCDRQATGGLYCSQTCRLGDLGKASAPSSPTFPNTTSSSSHQQHQPSSKYQDWTRTYTQPSASEVRSAQPFFMRTPEKDTRPIYHRSTRSLTPSSSRSSLTSTASTSNSTAISEQARQELQEYFHAFEQAKASKRRQSTW